MRKKQQNKMLQNCCFFLSDLFVFGKTSFCQFLLCVPVVFTVFLFFLQKQKISKAINEIIKANFNEIFGGLRALCHKILSQFTSTSAIDDFL